jgi:hypothetical protein
MILTLLFPIIVVTISILYLAGWFLSSIHEYQQKVDKNDE